MSCTSWNILEKFSLAFLSFRSGKFQYVLSCKDTGFSPISDFRVSSIAPALSFVVSILRIVSCTNKILNFVILEGWENSNVCSVIKFSFPPQFLHLEFQGLHLLYGVSCMSWCYVCLHFWLNVEEFYNFELFILPEWKNGDVCNPKPPLPPPKEERILHWNFENSSLSSDLFASIWGVSFELFTILNINTYIMGSLQCLLSCKG